ncbi:succinate dehydrogenase [Planktotalea arctica]|uniref:succinate dehydrogenase n=1 Tax=Planktotalea arctica TaxID=1481893 RepID=UPI000A172AE2|nr:succinate dehydrogenase [Planktotalea arctica]
MRLMALPLILALGGCAVASDTADTVARKSAKGVVNGVVAQQFPGVNAAPITDCVIDNATRFEIFDIAKAGATGVTQSTVEAVTTIAQRPETVNCISKNGLGLFL